VETFKKKPYLEEEFNLYTLWKTLPPTLMGGSPEFVGRMGVRDEKITARCIRQSSEKRSERFGSRF